MADAGPSNDGDRLVEMEVQRALARLRTRQNLPAAIFAGITASFAGGAVWTTVSVSTGSRLGFLAIGVALLTGFAVRIAGNGIDRTFGYISAACLLGGVVLSNTISILLLNCQQHGVSLPELLQKISIARALNLLSAGFSPLAIIFYLIALYIAYRQAFRKPTVEMLDE